MSWDEDDFEYSNGADGSCQECGRETDEPWHALCRGCFARQQGWTPPARPEPGTPPESFVAGLAQVREQMSELLKRVEALEHLMWDRP